MWRVADAVSVPAQLASLKERQEQVRHDAVSEKDEALADLRRRHDHEKLILQDENQKLITDIDRVSLRARLVGGIGRPRRDEGRHAGPRNTRILQRVLRVRGL